MPSVHTLRVVAAGCWFGGVFFTSAVVTPALAARYPDESERVEVRAMIGRHYAPVAGANLAALLPLTLRDCWRGGFSRRLVAEGLLVFGLCGIAAGHGGYFGPRLARLAAMERAATDVNSVNALATRRRALQARSMQLSRLNVLLSLVIAARAADDTGR
jgi:hypothetical protein